MNVIDRQDAINLLEKWADGYNYIEVETESAIKQFQHLPSAEPVVEVVKGEWVRTEVGSEKPWKCSECGYQPAHYSTKVKPYEHYCGNCGARMVEK